MSQKQRLLDHLKTGDTIDRLRALTELGIFELSARIIDIENEGHSVSKVRKTITNRWGENCRVVEYSLTPVIEDVRLLFVGGQEDGIYHVIPNNVDHWNVAERKDPIAKIYDAGAQSCNEVFKIFVYVRRGNTMYFEE